MKIFRFLLLSLLYLLSGTVHAEEREGIHMSINNEVIGKSVKVEVRLNNHHISNYTAFQMDITIPEDFDYVESSIQPGLRTAGHILSVAMQPDHLLRVTGFSPQNAEISGQEGSLFTFILAAKEAATKRTYRCIADDILFTQRNGDEHTYSRTLTTFRFTPSDYKEPYDLIYMVDNKEYKRVKLTEGAPIPEVEAPAKEGYTFTGWKDLPDVMPSSDLTVSATFSVNTYTITYYLNGAVYGTQKVKYGEVIHPLEVKETDEETFLGWESLPNTMPAKDLKIYGKTEITGIDNLQLSAKLDVYNLQGIKVLSGVSIQEAKDRLPRGIYIINGFTIYIK